MARELPPLPEWYWDRWPVCAPGDWVTDGVVFHPVPGWSDTWQPHECLFYVSGVAIRDFRAGARALVDMLMDKHNG